MNRFWLVVAPIVIGPSVVALEALLFSRLTGRTLGYSLDVAIINAFVVAFPYLILATFNVRSFVPWLVGLSLTLSLWAFALHMRVQYALDPLAESGDNLGVVVLVFLSPIYISAIVLVVHLMQQATKSRNKTG